MSFGFRAEGKLSENFRLGDERFQRFFGVLQLLTAALSTYLSYCTYTLHAMGSSALQTARRAFVKVLLVLAVVYGLTLNSTRDGNCARSSRLVGQLIFARKGGAGRC